ncbi:MAG: radical SAM family heme chaperone HemW [Gammaproteobacteria bacterium]|nr:radical SAM family heme chaperone HemW [Gammaproteobacteria bacterium]
MQVTPLSLYIHIPWCERKCPYCDFNSHQARAEVDEAAYVASLINDLQQDRQTYQGAIGERKVQSIFIGGGTPSLFAASSIGELLAAVRERLSLASDVEVTLEANPGSSEAAKFADFRHAGVNRLSIGAQSFNDEHLTALGRVHSATQSIVAAGAARDAGFSNFNLDLMFGLPGQSQDQALADLRQALDLNPAHISCYQLTIEPNTLFHKKPPARPDEDALWQMQGALQTQLAESGYRQYEVSAYALDQQRCQHNLNYWQFGDYLGIGAGAHGKITNFDGQVTRYWKQKHPASYMVASGEAFSGGITRNSAAQTVFEFMLNALRLNDGFTPPLFEQRCGQSLSVIEQQLNAHQQAKLMRVSDDRIQPTELGRRFIDTMLQDYLPD